MEFVKKIWPFLFIFLFWALFSSPFLLHGRTPYPSTYQVSNFAPWDAYGLAGAIKNQAMPDVITQIYPWKYFTIQTLKSGEIPFWNPYAFSGTPHLANYQSAVLSPFNLLFFILPFIMAWGWLVLLQPLLAGIFMLIYLRTLKISNIGSSLGSISFMFCGFITVWMGYATLGYAVLFLPLGLFAIEKSFQTKKIIYQLLLCLCILLSFFSGHFQISLYVLLFLIVYIVWKGLVLKSVKYSLLLLLYVSLGFLITLPQILPTLEFYKDSIRSSIFQKVEVIPWAYLPTFIAPDFLGNPVTRNDWFGHYAEWNGYIGLLPLLFAFYSIKSIKKSIVLFYFLAGIVCVLFAFPSPLLDLLIALHVPVLSTSAVSRIIVLYSFSFCVLGSFGFDFLIEDIKQRKYRQILLWLGATCLIFITLWTVVLSRILLPLEKISIAKQNLILPTVLYLTLATNVLFSLIIRKVRTIILLSIIIVLLVSFDMFRFATKWQTFDNKNLVYSPVGITKELPSIFDNQKVMSNFDGSVGSYYGTTSLDGYDSLFINRYGEFVSSLSTGRIQTPERNVVSFPKNGKYTTDALNLLNVAYVVHKRGDDFTPWTFPYWSNPGQFSQIYQDDQYRVYKNLQAFPHAFLVSDYRIVTQNQKIIDTLFSKNFNAKNTVILEKKPSLPILSSTQGNVKITSYTPDIIKMTVNTNGNSLLFLSDPYYSGWNATVDGKQTEIYRSDYAFRSIVVPDGKHVVIFSYFPDSFRYGIYAALVGLLGICVVSIRLKK